MNQNSIIENKSEILVKTRYNLLIEYLTDTSSHGLKHIFGNKPIQSKVLWIFSVVLSLLLCLYLMSLSVISYFSYSVVTTLRIEHEQFSEFPTVTICNKNAFVTKYAQDFVKTVADTEQIKDLNQLAEESNNFTEILTAYEKTGIEVSILNINNSMRSKFSYTFNEMIIVCRYNKTNCDEKDFNKYFSKRFGNCYTFNSGDGEIKKSYKPGSTYGLIASLFLFLTIKMNKDKIF
jgi:hypothetical protein